MEDNKIEATELISELNDLTISPKGMALLGKIDSTTFNYKMSTSTPDDLEIESGRVGKVYLNLQLFMNCKLAPNKSPPKDHEAVKDVSDADIFINIMKHMRDVADPKLKIGSNRVTTIMNYKIEATRNLKKSSTTINIDSLIPIFQDKGNNLQEHIHYNHNREHNFWHVNTQKFSHLKDRYGKFKGSALKGQILSAFKEKLLEAQDEHHLKDIVKELKASDEYKILSQRQGFGVILIGKIPESIIAFKKLIKEVERSVKSTPRIGH